MSEIEQEEQKTTLPIRWHVPDNLQSRYANNVLVQSSQYDIVISFFETQLPPLAGSPKENQEKLIEMGAIRADCVSRIIVSPELLPSIISALQTGLASYQETYGSPKSER